MATEKQKRLELMTECLEVPLSATESLPKKRMRVGLISDFKEERWPSMDLVSDRLCEHLDLNSSSELAVTQLRPVMRRRFQYIPIPAAKAVLYDADRLTNRFVDYPVWLRRRRSQFDLFHIVDHSYAQLAQYLPADRVVVTCHDLDTFRCLLEPEREPRPRWFRAMTHRILAGLLRAAHVICPSEATRSEILRHGWLSPDRVTVIHFGVDPALLALPDATLGPELDLLPGLDPSRPYLLHVGSTIPRKRIDVLLRVFAGVRQKVPNLTLVKVGGEFTAEQRNTISSLGLDDSIVVTAFLPPASLSRVYRRASALLQTSDAEGFGLPVIEAMGCGCPVVASDLPVLREVGGTAAVYCPVGDIDSWKAGVVNLLMDRSEGNERWTLRLQAILEWARNFTWVETARRTADIYRRVLEGRG